jgi:hypothetical protein
MIQPRIIDSKILTRMRLNGSARLNRAAAVPNCTLILLRFWPVSVLASTWEYLKLSGKFSIQHTPISPQEAEHGKRLIGRMNFSVTIYVDLGLLGIRLTSCSPKERRLTAVDGLQNEFVDAVAGRHRGE